MPLGRAGLAPHHDDVELFICQTSGAKLWRLYAPLGGFRLPGESSSDLKEEDIGPPIAEFTLNVSCTVNPLPIHRLLPKRNAFAWHDVVFSRWKQALHSALYVCRQG